MVVGSRAHFLVYIRANLDLNLKIMVVLKGTKDYKFKRKTSAYKERPLSILYYASYGY